MRRLLIEIVTVALVLSSYSEGRTYFNTYEGPLRSFEDIVPNDDYIGKYDRDKKIAYCNNTKRWDRQA